MAQNSNLYRRRSGIYAVRLVVPVRLRQAVGKGELHLSTGSRTPAVAKAIASAQLAHWRERFLRLEQTMNFEQIAIGSPMLVGQGYMRLADATATSGIDEEHLLREVEKGALSLFVRTAAMPGHFVPFTAMEVEQPEGGYVVPLSSQMPSGARQADFCGVLGVRGAREVAAALLGSGSCEAVLFSVLGNSKEGFAPEQAQKITKDSIEFEASGVEALRVVIKARMTPEQLELSRERPAINPSRGKGQKRMSEVLNAFMAIKGGKVASDQARRIRAACQHFIDAESDPKLGDVDRERLSHYVPKLKAEPADKTKALLKHGMNIPEEWPRISEQEIQKRLNNLSSLFRWAKNQNWIDFDPAENLAFDVATKKKQGREQDQRDHFTHDELTQIFGEEWYQTGRGELSKANTFREFQPHYYWLPLLGLFTGARIGELCQLHLSDIKKRTKALGIFRSIRKTTIRSSKTQMQFERFRFTLP
ncbi:MAG: site-specific integrase [Aquabacterium sp.]|uniref:site-specific integrase n=1 Tax=Aquabacterium sp. TaxID=1872578 RepID=UPI0027167F49|nr:site-specific integrase [Aquabacterium sp.]MDO9004591.1 site-specific integrase [Aquabacterium sp.]